MANTSLEKIHSLVKQEVKRDKNEKFREFVLLAKSCKKSREYHNIGSTSAFIYELLACENMLSAHIIASADLALSTRDWKSSCLLTVPSLFLSMALKFF